MKVIKVLKKVGSWVMLGAVATAQFVPWIMLGTVIAENEELQKKVK